MTEAVVVDRLRVVRRGRAVVDGLSLTARFGRVLALLGPNGAGKSSALKAIMGLLPFEGTVRIGGDDIRTLPLPARARRVAFVPQRSELRAALAVREVVLQGRHAHLGGRLRPSASDEAIVAGALARLALTHLGERAFTSLSQGEQQRVLVARALATEARILMLDEPTASLDIGHALRLYELLRTLAQAGYCVVTVLHPLEHAVDWADDAVLIDGGRVAANGTARDVVRRGPVERIYGVRVVPEAALGFRLPELLGGEASCEP